MGEHHLTNTLFYNDCWPRCETSQPTLMFIDDFHQTRNAGHAFSSLLQLGWDWMYPIPKGQDQNLTIGRLECKCMKCINLLISCFHLIINSTNIHKAHYTLASKVSSSFVSEVQISNPTLRPSTWTSEISKAYIWGLQLCWKHQKPDEMLKRYKTFDFSL